MRFVLTAGAAAAVVAVSAPAAGVDPKTLVLTQPDLPAGYRLDRQHSYVLSNARFSGGRRRDTALVARSGRLNGYVASYDKRVGTRTRTITSRTDVLRRSDGPRSLLLLWDAAERKRNVGRGLLADGRERARIGTESWVYWSGGYPADWVSVVWRHGRFFGVVSGSGGVGKQPTLALARKQERLIAKALR